jgi:phosphoserine aminotransferase
MSKIHNFSAGPSILAESAFEKSIQDIKNFAGTGLSILEVSHRGKEFEKVMADTVTLVRELLNVPENYDVLFLQGGASTQFFQIPMNFLKTKATYTQTGTWASRAIIEAQGYGNTEVLASSKASNFSFVPKDYTVPADADYFHCTSNNTIFGTQMKSYPNCGVVPLICDMSSDIFSKPVDVSKFAMIYAGAQKNMGPAGVNMVVVNEDILGKVKHPIPTIMDYRNHIAEGSMLNTPPVFAVYVCMLTLRWLKNMGGISAIEKLNNEKAALLYNEIDRNELFTTNVFPADRSKMNVCFAAKNEIHEKMFLEYAEKNGIVGIKGHRLSGAFRASLYNALPVSSVQVLVDLMKNFTQSVA